MRIAALYDIHANLPALEAVLGEVSELGVDCVVVGGDVVPGPMPRETLAALRSIDTRTLFIQGNGERDTLAMLTDAQSTSVPEQAREIVRWTAQTLSAPDLEWLRSWPESVRLNVEGVGDVLFCHATPRSDREIFTVRTPEHALLPIFAETEAAVVVCGHTHMQFERIIAGVRVVNAGSLGMPFGDPGAYWLLVGNDVELRCTAYDTDAAAERIAATDYPWARDFAERSVRAPASAGEMTEIFERSAIR